MARCVQCGQQMSPNETFCQFCGQQTGADQADEAQPAVAPLYTSTPSADDDGWRGAWVVGLAVPERDRNGAFRVDLPEAQDPPEPPRSLRVRSVATGDLIPPDNAQEREYTLDGRELAIGRSRGCDISLPEDQLASRRHALLRQTDGQYMILDLGSSNGTFVNGHEINQETPLHAGDRIKVGSFEIVVSAEPAGPGALVSDALRSDPFAPSAQDTDPQSQAPERAPASSSAEAAFGAGPFPSQGQEHHLHTMTPSSADGLETLRASLSDIGAMLAQRVEAAVQDATMLRAGLRDVREALAEALAAQPDPQRVRVPENLPALITVADQAAENPHHLDYVTRLAMHSGELASALHILEATHGYSSLLMTLQGLCERLDRLSL